MRTNTGRTLLTLLMNVLVIAAIALTVRLGVEFFGSVAAKGWAEAIVAITDPIVIPFGFEPIKTPYGGIFDVDAAIMVALLLIAEWVLSGIRGGN